MAKIFSTTILLVALAGIAKIEAQDQFRQATGNYGRDALNSAAGYAQEIPSHMQNGMSSIQNQAQHQGGLLSGLLGGGGSGASNSGPLETLRQLPGRGLQMLSNMLSGVRNMLPLGLGRNAHLNQSQNQNAPGDLLGQLSPDQLLKNLPKNPITDMAQGLLVQNRNGNGNNYGQGNALRLPNLNQITNPITEPLQQNRLPNLNEISKGATSTVRDLTSGLMSIPSNLSNSLNNGAQSGVLGGLLSGQPSV